MAEERRGEERRAEERRQRRGGEGRGEEGRGEEGRGGEGRGEAYIKQPNMIVGLRVAKATAPIIPIQLVFLSP